MAARSLEGRIVGKEVLAPIEIVRKYTLGSLLDDLAELETTGLSDDRCALVKIALSRLANAAAEIPDGSFFRGTILHEVEEFAEVYAAWNGYEGREYAIVEARKSTLRKLRKSRQKIARRIHLNQHVLENKLDLQLVDATNAAFADLVQAAPQIFKSLGKALEAAAAGKSH